MLKSLAFAPLLLVVACVSNRNRISETPKSLADIRYAIIATMGEPKKISENGREFTSEYFSPTQDSDFDPEKSKIRAYAFYVVLGDSRPYDITVDGYIERKTLKGYSRPTHDQSLSKRLLSDFTKQLGRSRGKGNVIDDFRPF